MPSCSPGPKWPYKVTQLSGRWLILYVNFNLTGSPHVQIKHILDITGHVVKVLLEEISTWAGGLSKADSLPNVVSFV